MRIAMVHGYLLHGTGSNIYVQNISRELINLGHEVHIFCQEHHPEDFSFIKAAYRVNPDTMEVRQYYENNAIERGAIVINPELDLLPVYVMDKYPEFKEVKLFIELTEEELNEYIQRNLNVLFSFYDKYKYDILHTNHLVMTPYFGAQMFKQHKVPYVITPHGSSLVYTIQKDSRYRKYAIDGLKYASQVLPGNENFMQTIIEYFQKDIENIKHKMHIIPLGVDTNLFVPILEGRRQTVWNELVSKLKNIKGGRTKSAELDFIRKITSATTLDIGKILNEIPTYSQKSPDENVAEKLMRINPEKDRLLIFVGRLILGKGIHNFLISVAPLLTQFDNLKVLVIGAGPVREWGEWLVYAASQGNKNLIRALIAWEKENTKENPSLLKPLFSFVNSKQFEQLEMRFDPSRVIFTGFLDHHYLAPILGVSEIACFPSLVPESFGLVLLEAASCGVLPVASYFSGFKTILDEFKKVLPENIWKLLILPHEGEAIIPKMIHNLAELLKRKLLIGNDLRSKVVEKYSWRGVTVQLSNLYKEILYSHTHSKKY
ncbi:MAG: glycosyltransferase family 4 protein [Candidatus Odinarchaeota archaeon]|nr:glycosyltransferase family 4 protein [Candidatus Odinarchaeota archaeon]